MQRSRSTGASPSTTSSAQIERLGRSWAAAGSAACLAAVIRNNIHYDSLKILEGAYGVSLRELALFAEATYRADDGMSPVEKAISVLLFKLEGQTILRHPNWHMGDRLLLGHVDVGRVVRAAHARLPHPGRARPLTVGDTDTGVDIRSQIADLRALLDAYRSGELPECTARS